MTSCIARNPCNLRGASVEHSPERPVLSVAEVEAVAGAIEERYRALVLLAAWCGLRLGEALALTRADVDLEEGSVSIDKSAAELKSGERIVGPPKTKAGIRKVFVPPHVVPALAQHLEHFSGGRRPRTWCSREPTDSQFAGARCTRRGCGQPRRLGWTGSASTTCATQVPLWRRPPVPVPKSS